jgi:hypothetical protein
MFTLQECAIECFVRELRAAYRQTYSDVQPQIGNIVAWVGRLALENIANSDTLYHNVEHTIMISLVAQAILKGKHLCEGGETVALSPGGTNVALTPYHVDRSKLFIHERFGGDLVMNIDVHIDAEVIASYIEMTRFPVPDGDFYKDTKSYAGLVRAADFVGQLGDPNYLLKIPALFYEFEEMGTNEKLGYKSPGDMRRRYAKFFWDVVSPYIQDALYYLRSTQEGKLWIANLHSHVFEVEHDIVQDHNRHE